MCFPAIRFSPKRRDSRLSSLYNNNCKSLISGAVLQQDGFPLVENVLKPSTHPLDTALDTENSRPEGGKCALFLNDFLSPSPGRTLDQVYTAAGKVLEIQANQVAYKLGLGPHVIAQKIRSYFGDAEQRTKVFNTTSLDAMSELWNRPINPTNQEWMFWQKLAATCLSNTTISAILEERSVSDSTTCSEEGLSVLKDIGVDIPTLGLIDSEEALVDYDGVDLLATALLGGLSFWFHKLDRDDWAMQPWYETFTQVLQLLREPRAGELLPNSSASATDGGGEAGQENFGCMCQLKLMG
ncbi:hypothetical protein B0H14DRAFT_3580682 [Mycena olivaceomarginata]|nr:hypothetical protein B0H14DRAFT_3580682 [Mycena olivaceomarginata]